MSDDEIVVAAVWGRSACELAAEHDLPKTEVLATLDRAAAQRFSGENLRRELLLAAERLTALEGHYFARAMGDGEGSATAAAIFCKLQERKSTLLGLNAQPATASITIRQAEPHKITSTERIRQLLDDLRASKPNGAEPPS